VSLKTNADRPIGCAPDTVRALLAQRAAQSPDAVFAIDASSGRQLSYAELQARAAAVARSCARFGLAPGDRIAMLLDNRLASAELLLGAMAGGFVPVPLNPNGGAAYLEQVLAHCDARLVVASADYLELLEPARCIDTARPVRELSTLLRDDPSAGVESEARGTIGRDDPALLIYTSGTTGQPRGACFSQAQILASADHIARRLALDATDRFLCVVPLSHLNGFEKLLSVCWTGGSVVLPDQFRTGAFWELLTRHRCTWASLVPTIVRQLLQHAERHPPPPPAELAHVRFMRSSSAPLPPSDHVAFEERFGLVLAEGMGMTEAGSIFQNPPSRGARKVGSLGIPCGFEVRLLDADSAPVAEGETGEIAVRGASLMTGYYKNPAATAAALSSDGWLRSGDHAYRDADGYYFHAGRAKELIIKGGVNISPAEIDAAVGAHPDVLDAAAVGVSDRYFGQDIALFVVARPGAALSAAMLREFCERRLGTFKTPGSITFVDALPRDVAGKVQRYRLATQVPAQPVAVPASPPSRAPAADEPFVAARTSMERLLAALWCEHLGQESIGIHDDFFLCGGTSIAALRILSRLRCHFGVDLPLAALVEAPSIAEQVVILDGAVRQARAEGLALPVCLTPGDASDGVLPLFCAYGWMRYRALATQLGPTQPVYAVYDEIEFDLWNSDSALGSPAAPWPTLAAMARRCVVQVRAVQPDGPYRLAGHSFGGLLVLEMAHQLRAAGCEVSLLAIIDSYAPGGLRQQPWAWFTHHVRQSLRGGPAYVLRGARERLRRSGIQRPAMRDGNPIDVRAREWSFRRQARASFAWPSFDGRIVLFRATSETEPTYHVDPDLGWRTLARGGLEVHNVGGGHQGVLREPHIAEVAAVLRPLLGTDAPASFRSPKARRQVAVPRI